MEPRAMDDDASATGEAGPRPPKRQSLGTEGPRRPKRGKYTPVACDECKKRKLKCIPAGDGGCERCIAGGLACAYASGPPPATKQRHQSDQVRSLSDEMAQLRQQVADLVGTVKQLKDHSPRPASMALQSPDTTIVQSPSTAQKEAAPKQPQFVGPTRPSFGLLVGERSLTRMGIPTFESPPPSGAQSPAEPLREITSEAEFWHHCTPGEMARLLAVFEEEVESVYPFIDIVELASRAQQILDFIRSGKSTSGEVREEMQLPVSARDVEMAKVAIATALAVEAHGKSKLSATIAETVERNVSRISSPQVELKEIQLLTMLSIYYFHCDDELLAWRTIGIAAREALEMGLHRRKSLFDNFRTRTLVAWLHASFDRDIDPGLPEPDSDFCYLKCMVGYGRLCSKLWDAIPPLGSASQSIPEETVHALDLSTQDWLESIPSHLRLRHPRLGLAARTQPRVLHRLRALLYLRGNHTRISVYQHYLFNTTSITANLRSAWLVVNIALDSVQILVHLNATTDIYSRQQNAFNYFLVSAMAVIFLAVCHAPNIFTEPCRKAFLDAVDLVRGFSRHSVVSRRLWKSIRGLLPRLRSLGLQSSDGSCTSNDMGPARGSPSLSGGEAPGVSEFREALQDPMRTDNGSSLWDAQTTSDIIPETEMSNSVPDMFQMRNDLLDIFDALGQGQHFPGEFGAHFYGPDDTDLLNGRGGEISRRLQGLI
ncbi:fungal specific transcription factor [Hirsutella rhossiliensis]|uniref:Fungal specific transcription factor n=1 Tax=Hirsutella rhossiliensis TaxID=111463 RepID=A0A9P8MNG5_9HYPO|nr:fungal specific transcription factor [Hirsutella rhossiliensis]KAH0958192.1 fungal specific transcription factor [Hirsutella rhossiliensis]